jgi:integrase
VTHDDWNHHRRASGTVTHSKEDALSEREFELLVEGARQIDGYRRTEAEFIIFVAGRLGLRRGELTHLRDDWIDQREKLVRIPAHQECRKGEDGGMCGHCRQLIRQCSRVNDLPVEEVAENWWRPKTEAAVRGVPYDWSPRTELAIERFTDGFDSFERSSTAVSRRVKRAAELAPQLNPEDVYPHCLRATAATFQVGRGLGVNALTSMMGWSNLATAQVYVSNSDENTRRAVRAAHNR